MTEVQKTAATQKALAKLHESGVSVNDLVKIFSQPDTSAPEAPAVLPREITAEQKAAVDRLPAVFGKVVPIERRTLEPTEVTSLLEERETLKVIENMASARVDDIRTAVLNHNDIVNEGAEGVGYDKDGHLLVKGEVRGDESISQKFTVSPRAGSTNISLSKLQELADDPDVDYITHEDWLAMTRQTRVFDENKAMIHLRENPGLLRAIAESTTTGRGSVTVKSAKV